MTTFWPNNVGIKAIEVYFPFLYVSQKKLEAFDGVSQGKYTIGLGQSKMGFCGDQEDINSLCLTVVHNLMEKNKIDPKSVGRLEVGTETIIDKSKSVKSVLMKLFQDSGNTDIEGIDTTNACYGGTSALFNAVNWVESSSFDGRLAIVVVADIAVYASGNARCTGGAGAIAIVIGPNAPIVFDRGLKATHMAHAYDFYKPNMSSEYPIIDGQLSIKCYLSALDRCYQLYGQKFCKQNKLDKSFSLEDVDFMTFHTPYCKLIQKSVGRCLLNDFVHSNNNEYDVEVFKSLDKYKGIDLNAMFDNATLFKEVERASVDCSRDIFDEKTSLSLYLANNIGNMYTPSLYGGLVSLLLNKKFDDLIGKRVLLFSYGSGLASSMFSVTLCPEDYLKEGFSNLLKSFLDIKPRLDNRRELEPNEFVTTLNTREEHHNLASYIPTCSQDDLFPNTYYLTNVDDKFRRSYKRKSEAILNGHTSSNASFNQ